MSFTLLTFEPIYQNWGFWLKVRCYQVLLNIYLWDVVFISVAGAAAIKHLLTVINIHKEGSLGENTWKTLIKGEISHNCTNWQRLARVLMENILKSNKGSRLVSPEPRQPGCCSTVLRLGNKNKAGLEMNDLRKHETKLWSLEWSQIRFSLNFFPSFFLPQLRCWAALRPPRPNPLLRNRYQSKLNKSWIPWRKIFCDNVNKEITASLKFLFLKRKICASTFTPLPRLFLLWNLNPQ